MGRTVRSRQSWLARREKELKLNRAMKVLEWARCLARNRIIMPIKTNQVTDDEARRFERLFETLKLAYRAKRNLEMHTIDEAVSAIQSRADVSLKVLNKQPIIDS